MSRADDALARRAAREARRAAMRARFPESEDTPGEENGDGSSVDPIRAARDAARAAAVGAAVGAVRALTSRRDGDAGEDEGLDVSEIEDEDERVAEPEAEERPTEEAPPQRRERPQRQERPREGAKPGQVEHAVQRAREQLQRLSGVEPEAISSFERTGDGWRVTFEVLELRRIPETTDVLASYAVELDEKGNLVSYGRVRRYQRSEALDGSSS
jgi:gas vesicle protein GvpO